MFKKLLVSILAIAMILVSLPAFADTAVTCSVVTSVEEGTITVTGNAVGYTVITVVPADTSVEDATPSNLPVLFKQVYADGTYNVTLGMPDSATGGKYTVNVVAPGGEDDQNFVYVDYDEASDIVDDLVEYVADEDKTSFETTIGLKTLDLGIDAEDEVYVAYSDEIIDMLYYSDFDTIIEFLDNYNKFYALAVLSNAADGDAAVAAIEKYDFYLEIEAEDYITDERLDEDSLEELGLILSDINWKSVVAEDGNVDFKQFIIEAMPLAVMRNVDNWGEIKNCIAVDFKDVFEDLLSSSTYKNIDDKDEVFVEMMGDTFTDFDSIEESFDDAAKKVYKEENKKDDSSSGNKGGSFITPTVPPADTVDPEIAAPVVADFYDVTEAHWSYEAVKTLMNKGVISGFPDGTFRPDQTVTRAEFTKMIMSYAEGIEGESANVEFADVTSDDWFFDIVTKAASLGIVNGTETGFMPGAEIKREDAALIIYRMHIAKGTNIPGTRFFSDRAQISEYAKRAVGALGSVGMVNGDETGEFNPQGTLTRAQAAQLVYNAFAK